jgi:hypothetical protein
MEDGKQLKINNNTNCNRMLRYSKINEMSYISELESNVTEMKKRLNNLQISKSEYEKRYFRDKEECDRLKDTEVNILLVMCYKIHSVI